MLEYLTKYAAKAAKGSGSIGSMWCEALFSGEAFGKSRGSTREMGAEYSLLRFSMSKNLFQRTGRPANGMIFDGESGDTNGSSGCSRLVGSPDMFWHRILHKHVDFWDFRKFRG